MFQLYKYTLYALSKDKKMHVLVQQKTTAYQFEELSVYVSFHSVLTTSTQFSGAVPGY